MDPWTAKLAAAAAGSTMTALTSMSFIFMFSRSYSILPVTPFDVVKTRLQTQRPQQQQPLFPRPPPNTCCQSTHSAQCIRSMSSIARSISSDVVCVWEAGVFRTERVNGFVDAVNHVWRAEGLRGLWKGVGTSL